MSSLIIYFVISDEGCIWNGGRKWRNLLDVGLGTIAMGGLQVCKKIVSARKTSIINVYEMEKKLAMSKPIEHIRPKK